jgi:hypothetical protein
MVADISDLLARPGAELASELSGKSLLYKQSTFGIGEINDETAPEAGHASHRNSNSYAPAAS